MPEIIVREGESYENFIRRFRRACEQAGIHKEIKRREFYEKPSERRKRKLAEAKRKAWRRAQTEMSGRM
ncbi:MAG: 30S ribosomal protein S21 [candidate division WOR-3 bacterium]|nr:30S ribosomal protein S21 [candidate division WOR-3 bacterium]